MSISGRARGEIPIRPARTTAISSTSFPPIPREQRARQSLLRPEQHLRSRLRHSRRVRSHRRPAATAIRGNQRLPNVAISRARFSTWKCVTTAPSRTRPTWSWSPIRRAARRWRISTRSCSGTNRIRRMMRSARGTTSSIHNYQHNRNPFIDRPEWVQAIWGDGHADGGGTQPIAQVTALLLPPTEVAADVSQSPVSLNQFAGTGGVTVSFSMSGTATERGLQDHRSGGHLRPGQRDRHGVSFLRTSPARPLRRPVADG